MAAAFSTAAADRSHRCQYGNFARQRDHDSTRVESHTTRRSLAARAAIVMDRSGRRGVFIDPGIRMVPLASFRVDVIEQHLRRALLHDYRLSRTSCFRRFDLVADGLATRADGKIHAPELRRPADL